MKFSFLRKYVLTRAYWKVITSRSETLHEQHLMLSSMHFMDPYNFDLERVQRCVIHYAVPDGRIIPFCTMNSIHRADVEKKLGIPLKEWQKRHKVEITQPF